MKKIVFVFVFTISFQIGAQWVKLNSPDSSVYDLYILDNGKILCACGSGLYYSVDNFQTWDALINNLVVSRIKRDNYGNLYATSSDYLYKSTDQGLSWHIPYNISLDTIPQWPSNIFINDSGYIFTIQGYRQNGSLPPLGFKSTDFGVTWDRIWIGGGYGNFAANSLIENNTGTLFVSYLFFGPNFSDVKIIKKVLGGDWVTVYSGDTFAFDMYLYNQSLYFATGSWGSSALGVIKSTDDGNTFTQLNNGLTYPFLIKQLILKPEIFIALYTYNNAIFYSFDEGENWSPFNLTGLNSIINNVYLDDNQTLYACTNSGIYVYTGPLNVEDRISQTDFSLLQNYPNPFNPSTNIQYAIGSRQFVTLKVFDVLGKEIATLVNEEKPAGNYEVDFNVAQEFFPANASGVYFYQLKAGDYVETKKMILMK